MEVRIVESRGCWLVKSKHCGMISIPIDGNWKWDGNAENPTIEPSLNETWGKPGQSMEEFRKDPNKNRNHVFIRAGYIEYLGDCTHAGAGTTERIEPFSEAEVGYYHG